MTQNFSGGAGDPLVAQGFGSWTQAVARTVVRSAWPLLRLHLLLVAVLLVPAAVSAGLLFASGFSLSDGHVPDGGKVYLVVALVLVFVSLTAWAGFAAGASVAVVVLDAAGEPQSVRKALPVAWRRCLPMLLMGLAGGILAVVGLICLVLPGIWVMVVLNAALSGAVVVEGRGIARSFELVSRRFWVTFGRLFFGWFVGQALYLVVSVGAQLGASQVHTTTGSWMATVLFGIVIALPTMAAMWFVGLILPTATSVVTYAELRGHHGPGTSTALLAAEMTR